jgi:LmbE family N-acetylglucosaminyl deacetylase
MLAATGPAGAQLAPPGTGGAAVLADALRRLGANKRVLMIGAHPDDENNEALTLISRGLGAQAAYLSLTRGEGGQNLIGPELGTDLGIIRTEELLAARQIDGARQYFTRAYDFGFSKTVDEAFRFWPHDSLLPDVLDIIRRFRPQVIISIFSGTPRDGHGQHQVAGVLAREAFERLRDSSGGPVKLYRSARFDSAAATLTLDGGRLDPVSGQSYAQLAMASRSRHRSQGEGQLERPGPSPVRLAFWESRSGRRGREDGGLFAGVDTVLPARYVALIDSARARYNAMNPGTIVPLLARALTALGRGTDIVSTEQRAILESALAAAAGVAIDGVSDDAIVIAGQRVNVDVTVWNAGGAGVGIDDARLVAPGGWTVEPLNPPSGPVAPGTLATGRFSVTPADSQPSAPYFLRRPVAGALYDWSGVPRDVRGEPFEPPLLRLVVRLTIAGAPVTLTREVSFRVRDEVAGEVRRPVLADCAFDVTLSPALVVWPTDGAPGASGPRTFTLSVTNRGLGAAQAGLAVGVPSGWPPLPTRTLTFTRADETQTFAFDLQLPRGVGPGTFDLRAAASGKNGGRCSGALAVIDYPHIHPRGVVREAAASIRVAKIALPSLARVGYVRGAADRVPEALAAVGVPIELIGADTLARGNLSRYDAIIIGSRAYEIDPALVANNGRVLEYARGGGLVIVQYQQYPYVQGGFAPYPLSIARPHDRVTDEAAAVTVLNPAAPLLHTPNEIGPDDWQGWVQDRGLYFAHDWDAHYTSFLTMHDPGEAPLAGGLLVATVGRGTYVYTGLAFFRELPAGVPGAYRLFANLLALGKK